MVKYISMEGTKIDFAGVMEFLQASIHKEGTVLILGARAGGFFRGQHLYNTMTAYGDPSFSQLPRGEQFGKCYSLLTSSALFTMDEIDTILIASLNDADLTDADECLATLVKQGVFDVIVSTNVDNLLEQALEKEGMKELHDFDVFSPNFDTTIRSERKFPRRIIKAFGELRTRDYIYTMTPQARLHSARNLETTLKKELERNILAVGLDPVWDAEILSAISCKGKAFWHISEEELDKYGTLGKVGETRQFEHVMGINGSYSSTMKELRELLTGSTLSGTAQTESMQADQTLRENREVIDSILALDEIPNSPPTETPRLAVDNPLEIFISYVPEDELLCQELITHLSTLKDQKDQKTINIRHHRRIVAGLSRRTEIDRFLNTASLILLLVSANFIASEDDIHSLEIERAMELHEKKKALIIPIILRPVDFNGMPFKDLMSLPANGKPVTAWDDRDSAFVDIIKGIKNVIEYLKKNH